MARKPAPIVSAMKIYTTLKNLDQNGLLRKKLEHFKIGQPKILRSKIFGKSKIFIDKFSLKIEWKWKNWDRKIFDFWDFQLDFQWKFLTEIFEIFDLKNFGWPISKGHNFARNKRFWSRFFQSCVDFQGGEDSIEIRSIWSVCMPLQKKTAALQKN